MESNLNGIKNKRTHLKHNFYFDNNLFYTISKVYYENSNKNHKRQKLFLDFHKIKQNRQTKIYSDKDLTKTNERKVNNKCKHFDIVLLRLCLPRLTKGNRQLLKVTT